MSDDFDAGVTAFLAARQRDTSTQAQIGFRQAATANPDQEAELRRIARQTGVPVDTVRAHPDPLKAEVAAKAVDFDGLARVAPATASLLADVEKARVAHDDVQTLGMLETTANSFKRGWIGLKSMVPTLRLLDQSMAQQQLDAVDAALARGETPDPSSLGVIASQYLSMGPEDRAKFRASVTPAIQVNTVEAAQAVAGNQVQRAAIPSPEAAQRMLGAKTFGEGLKAFAEHPLDVLLSIGPESMVQSGPGMLAAIPASMAAGPAGAAATMGANSFVTDFASSVIEALGSAGVDTSNPEALRKAMADPAIVAKITSEAARHAGVVGAFDAASAGIAGKMVLPKVVAGKLVGRPLAQELANIAMQVPIQAGMGAAGEAGGELAAGQEIQPGQILAEAFGEFFGTPGEVMSASSSRIAALMGPAARAQRDAARAEQATQQADQLAELTKLAAASKLRERDADTFEAFMQSATESGPVQDVYIDPAALKDGLADKLAQASPAVAEQIQQAQATGTDIRIPVSEFAARVAGEDFAQSLLPHLKTEAGGMSRAEAEAYMQGHAEQLKAEVEKALAEHGQDTAFRASRDAVEADIAAQLQAAGRFNADANRPYAALVANWYAVQAARQGLTAQELAARYPMRITAASPLGGMLDQQGQQTPTEAATAQWRESMSRAAANPQAKEPRMPTPTALRTLGIKDAVLVLPRTYLAAIQSKHSAVPSAVFENLPALLADPLFATPGKDGGVDVAIDATSSSGAPLIVGVREGRIRTVTPLDGSAGQSSVQRLEARWAAAAKTPGAKFYARNNEAPAVAGASAGGDSGTHPLASFSPPRTRNVFTRDGLVKRHGDSFYQDARGTFSPGTNTIALLKGADLSTFLHESGHFFLHVQADMAARIQAQIAEGAGVSDGEREIAADMAKLLDWFGVRGEDGRSAMDTWHSMSLEQQREAHEKFARGFERYLFEGKAPSVELQGIFQRFRAWLVNVYRKLSALNVDLSDDVRGVMDRMLATADQIKDAEASAALGLAISTPEEAAKVGADFQALHEMAMQATQDAQTALEARSLRDMQWLTNAKGRYLKRLQAEAAAKRKAVEREVRAEVMAQPVYRAWAYLTGKQAQVKPGEQAVESIDTTEASGRLRTQVLREMYGTEEDAVWRRLSDLHMTSDTVGQHPEIVASLFLNPDGSEAFDSADALVQALAAAQDPADLIQAMTDQRVLERHGDVSNPEAQERAAEAAVHNDMRARVLAAEAAALDKAAKVNAVEGTGRHARTVDVLTRAAKEFAAQTIARMKVRDVQPRQFSASAARAGRLAAEAVRKGDMPEAATQKRNQLISHRAAQAAQAARDEVEQALAYFRKFDKRSKTLDAAYQDQIEQLLERYALRPEGDKAADRRASLAEWVAAQQALGLEPDIAPDLLREAQRKSYRDMTVEELRGLRDSVKQIEHLGRLKNKLLTAKDAKAFEAVKAELVTSIKDHAGDRRADNLTGNTPWDATKRGAKRFWASHLKVGMLARILDGGQDGGPMWERLMRPANEAGDRETTMRAKATAELSALLAPILKGKDVKQFFPTINRSLNREARLAIMLNTGNDGNLQRLLDGERWTMDHIQPVLDAATAEEWKVVQGIWDHFESYRPEIAAKERRVYGKEPEWVEPRPVQTRFGEMRGGYYPVKYDPARSARAEAHADAEGAAAQLKGAYTSATTRRSFTKSRADRIMGRPLLYSMDGLYNGVQEVIHDLSWHEFLIDANRLMKSDAVAEVIRDHYGAEAHQQIKHWLEDVAQGENKTRANGEQFMAAIRQGVSVAGLGFNVMSAAMQPLGITQSIVRVGAPWIGKGLAKVIGSPKSTYREVTGKSDFMRTRSLTRLRELNEVRNQVKGETRARAIINAGAYALMLRAQMAVDLPTWWGAYEKAIAEGNDDARSVSLADQAVIDSQGGGQIKDLSAVERGGPAQKLFTTFYSFFNTALNLGIVSVRTQGKAKVAADMLMLYVVPVVLSTMLKQALQPGGGDDDWDVEKIAHKLAAEEISYLMGLMVGVREFSGAVQWATGTNEFAMGYSGPTGMRMVQDVTKLAQQVGQGEFDAGLARAVINVAGELFALPAAQINRTIQGAKAIAEGDVTNPVEGAAALAFGFQKGR